MRRGIKPQPQKLNRSSELFHHRARALDRRRSRDEVPPVSCAQLDDLVFVGYPARMASRDLAPLVVVVGLVGCGGTPGTIVDAGAYDSDIAVRGGVVTPPDPDVASPASGDDSQHVSDSSSPAEAAPAASPSATDPVTPSDDSETWDPAGEDDW
jgi:hypothetical protein